MSNIINYSDLLEQFPEVPAELMDRGILHLPNLLPTNPVTLKGLRVAIVTARCPEEVELVYPLHHLRASGAEVHIITPDWINGQVETTQFTKPTRFIKVDKNISSANPGDYDAVIIPGGAWNPIILRTDGKVLDFIRSIYAAGKLAASICHGPQVLISADLVSGRKITGVNDIRIDLRNAGGHVIEDQPVVIDNNLLTSRGPEDIEQFTQAIIDYLAARHQS